MRATCRWLPAVLLSLASLSAVAAEQQARLPGLSDKVEVYFDTYGNPHIYASTTDDAVRALGYLHARDRLWQMDMFRRQASGATAEVLGRDGLENDRLMRQLGIRRGCEELWKSDQLPADLKAALVAYAEGVNSRLGELDPKKLPIYFQALEYQPSPWTPVDSLVFNKYMAWDQSGTLDDLWFGVMVEKLGVEAAEELWPLDRPYEQPAVVVQVDQQKLPPSRTRPTASAGLSDAYQAAFDRLSRVTSPFRGLSYGSNNWAVDGTKTRSGKPILCSDPHLGFHIPAIWYTAHLSIADKNIAGCTFPGGPGVIIGHNDHIGWGITNLQADAVDLFVETINPENPLQYKHRGEWKTLRRVTEKIAVRGEPEQTLDIDYTVHGPLIQREPKPIALCWNGLGPTTEFVAFWQLQTAQTLEQFLAALSKLTTPGLNMAYADIHGNIAMHPCGAYPLRLPGAGRAPLDGASGEHDWQGMIPADEMPLAVNPDCHYVASANGRPTSVGYPHYLGWMWDCSYRKRRINQLLEAASDLTVETMRPIQFDHYDMAAERFVPSLLAALAADLKDPLARRCRDTLASWNYQADTKTLAPVIWLRWFSIYREQVWNDEWTPRDIKQPGGSWGFSGTNRREPMIEVLEYLTREHPRSSWFDDRATPQQETRDDIARRSFQLAVESLARDFGPEMDQRWQWGNINRLFVRSMTGKEELGRDGGPVVGTAYTSNPGGNIGRVGGGASYRLIVDFGHPSQSLGVYPGGQSEIPFTNHYADQIKLWAAGEYDPLAMTGDPGKLPDAEKKSKLVLSAK
jgi:penicillin amidase